MSGICGVFCPRHPELASREVLDKMLNAIGHRGTAARRFYVDEKSGWAVGHVLAPAAPDEPQWREDENYVATLDGAIFNAPDFLRPEWRQHYKNCDTAGAIDHLKQRETGRPLQPGNLGQESTAIANWARCPRRQAALLLPSCGEGGDHFCFGVEGNPRSSRRQAKREPTGYPSYYWTQGEVEPLKQRLLSPQGLKRTGLLRRDAVQKLLDADKTSKKKSAGKRTWGLLVLQAWYEWYVNRNGEFFHQV